MLPNPPVLLTHRVAPQPGPLGTINHGKRLDGSPGELWQPGTWELGKLWDRQQINLCLAEGLGSGWGVCPGDARPHGDS